MLVISSVNVVALLITVSFCNAQILHRMRLKLFPIRSAVKNRLQEQITKYRERNTEHICYEKVGCFELPHRKSPLQKLPENPKIINTKFYLFNKNLNFSNPQILYYDDDGLSLKESKFDPSLPIKMVIHGYMSKWNEKGAIILTDHYLKMYDCNIILVDWQKGARGPQYAVAAANTEVVGRQVGLLLLHMIEEGLSPKKIHMIGFSLGAHIAGSAAEVLKMKSYLPGRITGLDAASPLFRNNRLRQSYKKLDKSDAEFVDVLHTDASPFVTDGFGLWEPIGHIDFFANGGQEQPGCTDPQQSIVISHFEGSLTREIACSHIRAFHLFIESIINMKNTGCQFTAYNCPGGLPSFERGHCFPQISQNRSLDLDPIYRTEIGRFGEDAKGEGVMYFSTKDSSPFCGSQLQATMDISEKSTNFKGNLLLTLKYLNNSARFIISISSSDLATSTINGYAVADYKTLDSKIQELAAELIYFEYKDENDKTNFTSVVYINGVRVRDMYGNSWSFCNTNTPILNDAGKHQLNFKLSRKTICKYI